MTSNKYRVCTLITIAIIGAMAAKAQSNSDSVIIQFLRTKPDIPYPFLKITRQGKGEVRTQNYFSSANEPVKQGSVIFKTYVFGSSASHADKYFLIEVSSTNPVSFKVIDKPKLVDGLASLFDFLKPYKLSESTQAQIVNQFSFTYY